MYLPISEEFQNNQSMCVTLSRVDVKLPCFSQTLDDLILSHKQRNKPFTELEVWYVIVLFTRCFIFGEKKRKIIKPKT